MSGARCTLHEHRQDIGAGRGVGLIQNRHGGSDGDPPAAGNFLNVITVVELRPDDIALHEHLDTAEKSGHGPTLCYHSPFTRIKILARKVSDCKSVDQARALPPLHVAPVRNPSQCGRVGLSENCTAPGTVTHRFPTSRTLPKTDRFGSQNDSGKSIVGSTRSDFLRLNSLEAFGSLGFGFTRGACSRTFQFSSLTVDDAALVSSDGHEWRRADSATSKFNCGAEQLRRGRSPSRLGAAGSFPVVAPVQIRPRETSWGSQVARRFSSPIHRGALLSLADARRAG